MDKEIKAKWIAALRSGKYKQGTNCLRHKDDRFCCLGVLCDIVDPEAWTWTHGGNLVFHGTTYAYPSSNIRSKVGLGPAAYGWLSKLNDDGVPFSYIADSIEAEL